MIELNSKAKEHYNLKILKKKGISSFIKWGQMIRHDTISSNAFQLNHLKIRFYMRWVKRVTDKYLAREHIALKFRKSCTHKSFLSKLKNVF